MDGVERSYKKGDKKGLEGFLGFVTVLEGLYRVCRVCGYT